MYKISAFQQCKILLLPFVKNNHPLCFSGVFRPPFDGVYVLTFYGFIAGTDSGNIYVKQNDRILCQGYLRPEQYDTATCTPIADLATGDSVQVTGSSGNPSVLRGDLYLGFNGFLIYDCVQMTHKGIKESVSIEFGVDFFLSKCRCLVIYYFDPCERGFTGLMPTDGSRIF